MKNAWSEKRGLLRSIIMYNWKPFQKRQLRQFYSRFIKPDDLCFDVGAHIGSRTRIMLDLGARVIGIEPQPACVEYLSSNYDDHPRFTLVEKAVGAYLHQADMHVSSRYPTVSTLSEAWMNTVSRYAPVEWDGVIQVEVITLDALIAWFGRPQFCKIDVEGYEAEVLDGLTQSIPALSFEFFPDTLTNTIRCIEKLESLGSYQFNWAVREATDLVEAEWVSVDAIKARLQSYAGTGSGDVYACLTGVGPC